MRRPPPTVPARSAEFGADTGAEGFNLARLLAAATGRAPGTDRKVFLTRAVLGATALVVLCVAGYAVAGGGSGSKSQSATTVPVQADLSSGHTKSWAAPADAGATNGNDGLVGSWLLSSAVVRGDGMGVTAYNATSGSPLWTVAPPSTGAVPCAMSQTVSSTGIGAVLFQSGPGAKQACNEIVAVDTTTGKPAWTAQLTTASPLTASSVAVEGTQVVAVGTTGAIGFNASTGKQSWTYGGPGKYCSLAGNATGSELLLQSTCADSNPKQQLLSSTRTPASSPGGAGCPRTRPPTPCCRRARRWCRCTWRPEPGHPDVLQRAGRQPGDDPGRPDRRATGRCRRQLRPGARAVLPGQHHGRGTQPDHRRRHRPEHLGRGIRVATATAVTGSGRSAPST